MKINIATSYLKSEELFQVCDQIIVAVKRNNAVTLKLNGVVTLLEDSLVAAREDIEVLKKHPLTATINQLSSQIDDTVFALVQINKGHKRICPANLKESADLVVPVIESSLTGFFKQNNRVKREWIKGFFDKIDSNAALTAAMTALNHKALLDNLRQLSEELQEKVNLRTWDKPTINTEGNATLINNVKRMLRNLMVTIETNALIEKDLNYEPLITNINGIQMEIVQLISKRKNPKTLLANNTTAPEAVNTSGAVNVNLAS